MAYVSSFTYAIVRFGRYLDTNLKAEKRDKYVDYLRHGGLRDVSRSVVDVAGGITDHVFGKRYFSIRCFLISAAFTLGSIGFFCLLSAVFSFSLSLLGNQKFNQFLLLYWSFPFKVSLSSIATWLVWSVCIDFVSLLKTRLLIRLLRNWGGAGLLLCTADFMTGFLIYATGICLLSVLPLLFPAGWIHPPTVSLETGLVMTMLAVMYGKATMPHLDTLLAMKGQLTPQAVAMLHSDAPQIMLAMLFLIQIVPFLTIGSDLFYASMMPSIWLWIFIGSVYAAKLISAVGAYLEFAFYRFKKKKRTLEVTGTLLIPVLLIIIYVLTLWPYAIALLVFAAKAFFAALGLLSRHLQSTMSPP